MRTEGINIESVLRRLDEDNIPTTNKKYIREHDLILSAKGLTVSRRKKYIDVMRWWASVLNMDFKKATKKDIINAIEVLNTWKTEKGTPYKSSTREAMKAVLKTFYKWLLGNDEQFPEQVSWVRTKLHEASNRLPEDILTEEEIEKLIKLSGSARNQAIIASLYESGFRASEFMGIRMRDIRNEHEGMRVKVNGKTGERVCLLVASVPYLIRYINTHPEKDNPDALLWSISYENLKLILKNTAERAGINKKVNPHAFRHSRCTFLARHLSDSQLKNFFGWSPASRMQAKYVHMSGADNDAAILRVYGMAEREDETSRLRPKECPICGYRNTEGGEVCERCYRPLNGKGNVSKDMREMQARVEKLEKALLRASLNKKAKKA